LSVRASHAQQMQANPEKVRDQLGASVCKNTGYRQLLAKGAVLTYRFTEYKSNRQVGEQAFDAKSCDIKLSK
ncbi:MAG: PA3611 family quorum-sensing-regulated virulence factor, partial [Pseudomonas sp.]